ncbi:MAG: hypothetical protein V3V46_03405 [Anaerolineales bacterium]
MLGSHPGQCLRLLLLVGDDLKQVVEPFRPAGNEQRRQENIQLGKARDSKRVQDAQTEAQRQEQADEQRYAAQDPLLVGLDHLVQNRIKQFNQLLQGEANDEDWAERFNKWVHQVAAFRYK